MRIRRTAQGEGGRTVLGGRFVHITEEGLRFGSGKNTYAESVYVQWEVTREVV